MRQVFFYLAITLLLLAMTTSCSGKGDGVNPAMPGAEMTSAQNSHLTWGMWQFTADPINGKLDITPLRLADMHLNALPFLEPPPLVNLTLESLKFNGNIIDADIGLRHPFLGLTEFTGFDVCGLLITNGSVTGFDNPDLRMAGENDTRLLNPDGYSRWWNPAEFPHGNTMFSYKDGLLGAPDSSADFNSTLNAYKYFCDDLTGPNMPLAMLDPADRCIFSPGQKNIRHYTIRLGTGGLVFNYAVDAAWKFPQGSAPYTPDDFPPDANRPEAWNVAITELENTLFNDGTSSGGNLSLLIDVWDHYNAGLNKVKAESPGNIDPVSSALPIGGGEGFSTYRIDIIDATPAENYIDIIIEVECETEGYQGLLPGEKVTAYFRHTADVGTVSFAITSPNGGEEWEGLTYKDIKWVAPGSIDYVDLYYSTDDFVSDVNEIKTDVPNTGSYSWYVPNIESDTVKVKMVESGGVLEDASDDFFTITKGLCHFGDDSFKIVGTYLGSSYSNYFTTGGIQLTRQSPKQYLFIRGVHDPYYNYIYAFDTSDINAGPVKMFDNGEGYSCNSARSFVVDGYSIPGVDRIFYQSGAGVDNQFKSVDWNGSDFVNNQTLPKADTYGIWEFCTTLEGDLYAFTSHYLNPAFYYYDKSAGYAKTLLFLLQPTTCAYDSTGNFKGLVYDPILNALVLFCRNSAVSNGGQLYVLDLSGNLIFQDKDIFNTSTLIRYYGGLYIDPEQPDCRVVVHAATDDGKVYFARYSADFKEKKLYTQPGPGVGYAFCRGDIDDDGKLWAPWDNITWWTHIFALDPPSDW